MENIKNEKIISGNGNTRLLINKFKIKKLKKVKITTNCGYFLECSEDHPILIANNFGEFYKKAHEIDKNDYVCIFRKPINGEDVPLNFININPTYRKRKLIFLPSFLNEEISWMIGTIIGDGCYTDRDDGTVELAGPQDTDILYKVKKIWESIGLNVSFHNKKSKLDRIYTVSQNFRKWLFDIGLDYVKAPLKKIPSIFFRSNIKCKAAY